jgi:hypothetical protein
VHVPEVLVVSVDTAVPVLQFTIWQSLPDLPERQVLHPVVKSYPEFKHVVHFVAGSYPVGQIQVPVPDDIDESTVPPLAHVSVLQPVPEYPLAHTVHLPVPSFVHPTSHVQTGFDPGFVPEIDVPFTQYVLLDDVQVEP